MFFQEKQAIQVNYVCNNKRQEPEFLTGKSEKIQQLIEDYQNNPTHFEEEVMFENGLLSKPELTINIGRFGFVPNSDIPIIATATYTINTKTKTETNSSWTIFSWIKLCIVLVLFVPLLFSFIMSAAASKMADGMNKLNDIGNECIVTTKDGKPYTIQRYGETLFYDRDGEIIIPDLREILPYEKEAQDNPFQHCKIITIDGI